MLEQLSAIALKGVEFAGEALGEASIKYINDSAPIKFSWEAIENGSLESLMASNQIASERVIAERIEQLGRNRENGASREELAHQQLQREFPEAEGYKIEREQYLRDENGSIVKDPETAEARRIDFVVTIDGQVVKSVEVTSETAPKQAQLAKEVRIRDEGGNFVKERDTGQLSKMPSDAQTETWRYA